MSSAPVATPWQVGIRTRLGELTATVRALIEASPASPGRRCTVELLATLERLEADVRTVPSGERRAADICELAGALAAAQTALRVHTLGLPFEALSRVHDALARIRGKATSAEIIGAAPVELCLACGFDRAMLSRVRGSTWLPEVLFVADGAGCETNRALREYLRDIEIPLATGLLEAELVRRRAPALVEDAQSNMRTFRPLVELSKTRAYVVAPIVATGSVVGFLHADTYTSGRPLTLSDRGNLQTFADGFGLIFERTVLFERLELQRGRIGKAFSATGSMIDVLCEEPVRLDRLENPTTAPTSPATLLAMPRQRDDDGLTPREREVLGLLASGATNGQIADQLTVSESTIKSHVKHILRKLRAANRAEAIARYLQRARTHREAS